jgi:hypothetical protein
MSDSIKSSVSKKRNMQKLRAEELESKFRDKRAVYTYLTVHW